MHSYFFNALIFFLTMSGNELLCGRLAMGAFEKRLSEYMAYESQVDSILLQIKMSSVPIDEYSRITGCYSALIKEMIYDYTLANKEIEQLAKLNHNQLMQTIVDMRRKKRKLKSIYDKIIALLEQIDEKRWEGLWMDYAQPFVPLNDSPEADI